MIITAIKAILPVDNLLSFPPLQQKAISQVAAVPFTDQTQTALFKSPVRTAQ
jgi:hypothetical protein